MKEVKIVLADCKDNRLSIEAVNGDLQISAQNFTITETKDLDYLFDAIKNLYYKTGVKYNDSIMEYLTLKPGEYGFKILGNDFTCYPVKNLVRPERYTTVWKVKVAKDRNAKGKANTIVDLINNENITTKRGLIDYLNSSNFHNSIKTNLNLK